MPSLAERFMEHSGKDEYGNLVLLFEDKKIKMAFGDDGEPLLSKDDLELAFQLKSKTWIGRVRPGDSLKLKFDKGLYKASGVFVKLSAVAKVLFAKQSIEARRLHAYICPPQDNMAETVKPVIPDTPGYDNLEYRSIEGMPGYCVADNGSVWSSKQGKWHQMAQRLNKDGYFIVSIGVNGRATNSLVHRLVLTAFSGPNGPGQVTLHGNGVKTDNRPSNLRWGTDLENAQDAARHRAEERLRNATLRISQG